MTDKDDAREASDAEAGLEPTGYRTGQVRIVGAELAGDVPIPDEETTIVEPVLPHWTEAATGEVPAVVARGGDDPANDDPWAALPPPTWREEESDWGAHEAEFEPSMLGEGQVRLGSLDDSGQTDRQPWAFDLPGTAGYEDAEDPLGAFDDTQDAGVGSSDQAMDDDELFTGSSPEFAFPGSAGSESAASGLGESSLLGEVDDHRATTEPAPLSEAYDEAEWHRSHASSDAEEGAPRRRSQHRRAGRRGRGTDSAFDEDRSVFAPRTRAEQRLARLEGEPRRRRPAPHQAPGAQTGLVREPPSRNVGAAVITGLVLGVLTLITFKIGSVAAMVLVTIVISLASAEAFAAFRRAGSHPVTLLGVVATVSVMIGTYNKGQAALPLVVILLVAFSFLWFLAGVERGDAVRGTLTTVFVFCWIGAFGSYAALLLNPALFPNRHGIAFVLGAIIAGIAYDVGALLIGAWLGKHPMAPSVSPNKMWEGFIGGALAAIVLAVAVVNLIHPWTVGKAAALGLIVAIVSPVGDLCESLVKRHLGLKDMGRLLPGHGGVLDRIDGLLFVLPATYYLVKAFHLG